MNEQEISNIIELIKSGITNEKPQVTSQINWEFIYQLATLHNVVPLMYTGIVNSGEKLPLETERKFFEKVCKATLACAKQEIELKNLFSLFDSEGIDYMPLKGTVIRDIYPKAELRMMGDADVLVREEQYHKIVPILENSAFSFVKESANEYAWKKGSLYLELHRYLLSPSHKDYFKFFGDGWQFAEKVDSIGSRYVMKKEDFYVYLVLHFAKHYRSAGIGIRHVTDIWLYTTQNPDMDMEYVNSQLEKIKLDVFHKNLLKMVDVWFNGALGDDVTYLMTVKVLSSGSYGTAESASKSSALKQKKTEGEATSRVKKLIFMAFPSFSVMKSLFPLLEKMPVLLPFCWIYRILKAVILKRSRIKSQYEIIKSLNDKNISEYEKELKAVGLDYKSKDE